MILIPSLEIMSGKLVRLQGGASGKPKVLSDDVLGTARRLQQQGAMFFHLVDLDAVHGLGNNDEVLKQMAAEMLPFQVRGGVRTAERVTELLALGADRVVLGPIFFEDEATAKSLVEQFGMRIMASLDISGDVVHTGPREGGADLKPLQALEQMAAAGFQHVIYNRIEGEDGEPALDLEDLKTVVQAASMSIYARCTVHKQAELDGLKKLAEDGLLGIIFNHALAKESLSLEKAMASV